MSEQTLGQRIAERRKMLSLSQEAFGEKLGVSRQAAFKWESDTSIPEVDKLIHMSRLFGVSVGWLLGEERTEPSTEEDPNALLEQIRLTFQPPEVEVPTSPEPPTQAAQTSPQEPPKRAPKRWMMIAVSLIAAVSLVASILSFAISQKDLRKLEETNAALQEKVDQYSTQISDLEELFIMLNERVSQLNSDLSMNRYKLETTRKELQDLIAELGTGTALNPPSNDLPTYDNLEVWSLTAEMGEKPSTIDLHFTATASVDIASAKLQVFEGDPKKPNSDRIEFDCTVSDRNISCNFTLPANYEYQYQLYFPLSNGNVCYCLLKGHGLDNPSELCLPTVRTTPRSVFVFPEKLYFSQGWFNIYVAVPYLAPQDADFQWQKLKIVHYQNEQPVAEHSMTANLSGLSRTDASLSFDVPAKKFDMPRFVENDIHDLYLEGTLIINGTEHSFSVLLRSWQIRQGEFVSLAE